MKCLEQYIRWIAKPQALHKQAHILAQQKKQKALRRICGYIVRAHKHNIQQQLLQSRAQNRAGLICANTRNAERLTPKGGVVYDETKRNKPRILDTTLYRVHRWPRRDKCGPTLAATLYYIWGIT